MSTPAQKANLARIRDNQRRSRARKREYVTELEQRLRTCELQGIEASAEVQMAARRVAEENRVLKEILHKNGVTDEYIAHCIHAAVHAGGQGSEVSPTASAPYHPGGAQAGGSMQSLNQLLAPRRPNTLDPSTPFLPTQTSREASIASGSTTASSMWGDSAQGLPPGYGHHTSSNMPPAALSSPGSHPFTLGFSTETTPRADSFSAAQPQQQQQARPQHQQQQQQQQQQHGQMMAAPRQSSFPGQQPLPSNFPNQSMGYNDPNAPFNPNPPDYGHGGGYA